MREVYPYNDLRCRYMCIKVQRKRRESAILYAMATDTPLKTANFAHPKRNVGALGVEPGMQVADFGSGSGIYVLHIAEALENTGRVYAIDVQRDLLRRVKNEANRRGFKNVDIIWTDLEHLGSSKLADKTLDLVLISNLLFQIENKPAVLTEALRVLKPVGRLAIIDWADPIGNASRSNGARSFGSSKEMFFGKEKALELAKENGFQLQREFPAGAHHYGLIFRPAPRTNP